jgi:DNA-binding GntR family transcriptional regulator
MQRRSLPRRRIDRAGILVLGAVRQDKTAMDAAATERRMSPLDSEETSSKSLGELAYDTLLDRMLSKELAPGTVLQERALGEELQISRTPIREALTRLESEGFVTRHAGRLLIVREIPVHELMEIFHVRSILEVDAIALAAQRIPMEKLAELRRLFESQMSGPIPDGGNHWDADDLLHGSIADASGNKVLADLVRNLRRKTRMFSLKRMPERFIPGSEEHLAIIAALEKRDAPAARAAMALHLENSKRSILQILGKV